jgi:dienelactone hydrolase
MSAALPFPAACAVHFASAHVAFILELMKWQRWFGAGVLAVSFVAAIPAAVRAAGMMLVPATSTTPAIPVYVVKPQGRGPFPALVILHGCEGFSGFTAVAADRLAFTGYVVAALDTLTPNGIPPCTNKDATSATSDDARAALAWLRTQPYVVPERLGVIGFSMGAGAALNLVDPPGRAAPPPPGLRAVVAFYPGCAGYDGNVAVPVAIFIGALDQITPAAACAKFAAAGGGKAVELNTYPGATHGFLVPGPDHDFAGTPVRYDAIAAADAAIKIDRFFALNLKAP